MGRRYTDDTKAEVMAALLAGQSVSDAAEEHDIPRGTVAGWSAKLNEAGLPNVSVTKKEELGDKLLANLDNMLDAQAAILEAIHKPAWLQKQDASQLAVLYGVIDDKKYRMLQMLANQDVSRDNAT